MTLKVRGGTPGLRHDRGFQYWLSQQKRRRRRLAGAGNLLAYPQKMAVIGDSIPWAQSSTAGINSLTQIGQWINGFSGGRAQLVQGFNKGIGGQTSAQYAARYTTDLGPLGVKIVFIGTSINGIGAGGTAAAELLVFDDIVAQGAALGHRQIFCPPLPTSSLTGPQEAQRILLYQGMLARQSSRVAVLNIDDYNATTDHYAQQGSGVRIHPNVVGAQKLGLKAAAIVNGWVAAGTGLLTASDPLNRATNGYMTGTGGSIGSLATGQLADNWTVFTNTAKGNITMALAKQARAAGGFWQQVTIGGTYIYGSNDLALSSNHSLTGFADGDRVVIAVDVEVDAPNMVNLNGFNIFGLLFATDFSANTTFQVTYVNTTEHQGGYGFPASKFILQSEPINLPAGKVPGQLNLFLTPNYDQDAPGGSPSTGVFRFGSLSISKPTAVPAQPAMMSAPTLAANDSAISVTRAAAPIADPAITGYDLRYSTDSISWTVATMSTNPQSITGLTNGTTYYVQTRAKNALGDGPWSSSASAIPAVPVWSPADLFAGGEDGVWYDFSDNSTLFQDTAGTVAWTTSGQTIGKILDKSGKNRHWVAADNSTKRPTMVIASGLRYLSFDGSDDEGEATGITGGILQVAMAPYVASASGSYSVAARFGTAQDNLVLQRDTSMAVWRGGISGAFLFNSTGMRINGVATRNFTINQQHVLNMDKTGTGASTVVHLGNNAAGVDRLTGRFYGAIIALSRNFTGGETTQVEAYIAGKAGVTL